MTLSIKHLNDDASFLLSFKPSGPDSSNAAIEPFRILLDPWVVGPSSIFHPKISTARPRNQACIASLAELPEPDLVIVSQDKSDHCNEATLRQLPATGTKTIILAEPNSARLIRSWKHFDKAKVRTIPNWEDSSTCGQDRVVRTPVKPLVKGGQPGEVTIAFLKQAKDISGLLHAIGITYRAPSLSSGSSSENQAPSSSPPVSPISPLTPISPFPPTARKSHIHLPMFSSNSSSNLACAGDFPSPPTSPGFFSLRSVRSASSIPFSIFSTSTAVTNLTVPFTRPHSSASLGPTLSVMFAPHGISYASLDGYAKSHLAAESALPLTALLHCFDSVTNPWWLGGKVLLGAPAGKETAKRLQARVWISAHDGDKEVKGLATKFLETKKWMADDLGRQLAEDKEDGDRSAAAVIDGSRPWKGTTVLNLGVGEEVMLDHEGIVNSTASC
ncbi:hypothetical protein DL546_000183 [Coniochaeta pulveracea]|uniref:Uncharacterized protein n=1 Tax=Coniochaeta pulveracea TaxID=177199 RepID=A0A420Y325_9PEZI|nr:hypothetical protein DL546_000183 [Coniochaeta pulveracea]